MLRGPEGALDDSPVTAALPDVGAFRLDDVRPPAGVAVRVADKLPDALNRSVDVRLLRARPDHPIAIPGSAGRQIGTIAPRMRPPSRARLLRIPLEGDVPAHRASLVRGDQRPFTLAGAWAGGGALVGSEPLAVAGSDEDPFDVLDVQPEVEFDGHADVAVGGGWFGFLGYGLGARLEPVPPSPPRPVPLPEFALAFYDHLLHLDAEGRWWFEALWTEERDAALRERRERLSGRLVAGVRERPVWVGTFRPAAPGAAGQLAAVAACRERIAAGEIFQANLCLRLDSRFEGNPADLFARVTRELGPRHAAFAAGPWGAVCSLSPELFLRRRGREVLSEPIKGTAPRDDEGRLRLARSVKDRAENVMIVDLMRNDLGRVCEYGSVRVPELTAPRPAPGVWHLVSSVAGTLRPDVGDGELLRATFPPGSVTGAPKIQTMRVIAELEASGREAYTGAIGYASPVAGLELNVAIRTLEISGDRIWLGAGGGITSGSDPQAELEECFLKARPVIEAAGGRLADLPGPLPPAAASPATASRAHGRRRPARSGSRRVLDDARARWPGRRSRRPRRPPAPQRTNALRARPAARAREPGAGGRRRRTVAAPAGAGAAGRRRAPRDDRGGRAAVGARLRAAWRWCRRSSPGVSASTSGSTDASSRSWSAGSAACRCSSTTTATSSRPPSRTSGSPRERRSSRPRSTAASCRAPSGRRCWPPPATASRCARRRSRSSASPGRTRSSSAPRFGASTPERSPGGRAARFEIGARLVAALEERAAAAARSRPSGRAVIR